MHKDTLKRNLKAATELLWEEESAVPEKVQRTLIYLCEKGIWFQLSRNNEVRSCREAANKRDRLGHEGIPLYDELKSYFGIFVNDEGEKRPFMAHCRGDRLLDLERVAVALQTRETPARMTQDELIAFGLEYGLVNPFVEKYALDAAFLSSPILQVFDRELTERVGLPGTMMTNAGDLTWAVEFFPDQLAAAPNFLVAPIAVDHPEEAPRPWGAQPRKIIGIITGNTPESGTMLWDYLNNYLREMPDADFYGDVSLPPVIVYSLPEMGLSMELDRRETEVWRALRGAVSALAAQGVRFLAVADNTTQYFTPQIRALCQELGAASGMEFISLPESLAERLRCDNIKEVALVGISYVADLGRWSAYREPFRDFQVETLSAEAQDRIHELAYQVKTEGVTEEGLNRLRDILRRYVSSETVILALTELSLLLQKQKSKGRSGKLLIDPLQIYAEAIAQKYLSR